MKMMNQIRHRGAFWRRAVLSPWLVVSVLTAVPPAQAHIPLRELLSHDNAGFMEAREAWRRSEPVRLARASARLEGHPLKAWADYWLLRLRLEADDDGGVPTFLAREAGSYLADRLRADWMRWLGQRGDWARFRSEAGELVEWDRELRCLAQLGEAPTVAAAERFRSQVLEARDWPAACGESMQRLLDAGLLGVEDAWARVRRLQERKATNEAARALEWTGLDRNARKDYARALGEISKAPGKYLERAARLDLKARPGRELALFAVQRLASDDAEKAAQRLVELAPRLDAEQQAYGWLQIASVGALKQMPQASAWFGKAEGTAFSEEQAAWRVRSALRAQDWRGVQLAIAALPTTLASKNDWIYWQGRALAALGRPLEARQQYERIAAQHDFYGTLAAEELGRHIEVPPAPTPASRGELDAVLARPGIVRGLALIRLDMRSEGLKEWNFALRGMDDRQLLAAAELARGEEIWDRAIAAATRTVNEHDFSMRFLAPYRDQVTTRAEALDLDTAWVYGLLRQESRFVSQARSSVGAQGLMQVMPATAKWVAKRIDMRDYKPSRIAEINTNVTLGTHYLKIVLESLDNSPVLASAAYNAGPGRARRWRAEVPLEGAIYAETIPFNETRDYVKAVMNNAAWYRALFERRPQSLKQMLGTVPARSGESVPPEALR
jgi:soluble lytic murein transglycosylase